MTSKLSTTWRFVVRALARPTLEDRLKPAQQALPRPRSAVLVVSLSLVLGLFPTVRTAAAIPDSIVLPDRTNAVQLCLYLDASPSAPHLFNTFEIKAHGETLLQSPDGNSVTSSLHNILIDGAGPQLSASNSLTLMENASGAHWRYAVFDGTAAYRGRLKEYRRGILFIEPDLFVVYDHLVAEMPVQFQMILHPPATTRLNPVWKDLELESAQAGFRIHAPGQRQDPRFWERRETHSDTLPPGTLSMQLGPTNKLSRLDLLTVFALHKAGQKKELAFKLLQSNTSVGARIHRDGMPTLVAFRVNPAESKPSLTGFAFDGPVGVDVFKPKRVPVTK